MSGWSTFLKTFSAQIKKPPDPKAQGLCLTCKMLYCPGPRTPGPKIAIALSFRSAKNLIVVAATEAK